MRLSDILKDRAGRLGIEEHDAHMLGEAAMLLDMARATVVALKSNSPNAQSLADRFMKRIDDYRPPM